MPGQRWRSVTEDMATPEKLKRDLRQIADRADSAFAETHAAREKALRLSRDIIRTSANSIRATHRGEYDQARRLLNDAAGLIAQIEAELTPRSSVYYAGFVEDAQKEYVEATATLAFTKGTRLPGPDELNVGPAPYLNGLAETVGELRRFVLDLLRRDDVSRCEELLELMDEVYSVLVTMDYPEAVTRGLRRNTDMARGVLERTRGDLTVALRQRSLEQRLAAFHQALGDSSAPAQGDGGR